MYYSPLFPEAKDEPAAYVTALPEYFKDLNLDQICSHALKTYSKFDIAKHYYTIIENNAVIQYRQDTMRDLEDAALFQASKQFCDIIVAVSRLLPKLASSFRGEGPMENTAMTKGSFLNAAVKYLIAMQNYQEALNTLPVHSQALKGFCGYLTDLFATKEWNTFLEETLRVREAFDSENYCLLIKNSTIKLRKYDGQEDEGKYIEDLFSKFAQGQVQEYHHKLNENEISYAIESAILETLVKMYPDQFKALGELTKKHAQFLDKTAERFAFDMQFYFSYLDFVAPIKRAGMHFAYPSFPAKGGKIEAVESFDLALARSRLAIGEMPIPNGFYMDDPERILVITGPNQGGKTTFARSVGQMMHLSRIGACVQGKSVSLPTIDKIFTHFEKEENVENGAGKLMDDLVRIKPMLEEATSRSFLVINEIFASTTLDDATQISRSIMQKLLDTGATAVWVTFIDEMASFSPETVSMMSTVRDDGSQTRTYHIERKKADGLAYAMHIARKHAVTYEQLKGRLNV